MKVFLPAALVLATAALPASAASLSVEDLLASYNGVTSGDFYSSQEVEGRLYVGGNLTGSTIQVAFHNVPAGSEANLVVVGDSKNGSVKTNGTAVIGGNSTSGFEQLGGPLQVYVGGTSTGLDNFHVVTAGQAGNPAFEAKFPDVDFDAIKATSSYLATLTGAVWTWADQNNKVIPILNNAVASEGINWVASKVTVLYTTLADLATGGYSANVASDETVIINVAGASGSFGMNALGGTLASAKNILWNFYEATDVAINTKVDGSILAPFATLTGFSGSTEGSVIAKSITLNNGELHSQPFMGDLPDQPVPPTPPAEVPLPAGLPLLAGALALVTGLRRRA